MSSAISPKAVYLFAISLGHLSQAEREIVAATLAYSKPAVDALLIEEGDHHWATFTAIHFAKKDPEKALAAGLFALALSLVEDLGAASRLSAILRDDTEDDWGDAPPADSPQRWKRLYRIINAAVPGVSALESVIETTASLRTSILNTLDGLLPGDQGKVGGYNLLGIVNSFFGGVR